MSILPNMMACGAFIIAFKVHKNLSLGELAASEFLKIYTLNVGCNILLSNMYDVQSRWSDVAEGRRAMKDGELKKASAVNSIELNEEIVCALNGAMAQDCGRSFLQTVDPL